MQNRCWACVFVVRLCFRFMPVEVICHADLDSIREAAAKLLPPHFPSGADAAPVAFAVSVQGNIGLH